MLFFLLAPKPDNPPRTCSPKQFVCKDQVTCISKGWRCDGEKDCPDGSDESPDICKYAHINSCKNAPLCVLSHSLKAVDRDKTIEFYSTDVLTELFSGFPFSSFPKITVLKIPVPAVAFVLTERLHSVVPPVMWLHLI